MELSKQAIEQINAEVNEAVKNSKNLPKTVTLDDIAKNETSIIAFLEMLVALLPGVIGKLAGQAIIVAAKAWFSAHK